VLEHSTGRAVARGKISETECIALHRRVEYATSLDAVAGCGLVAEAVPEHLDLKREIFAALDRIVAPDALLATHTSSLPARGPSVFEGSRTLVPDARVVDDGVSLARQLGKQPVVVGDKAGFIANALLFGYLNHAVSMYETRYASREDIDAAMRLGCGLPMGPLALMDLIGLDTAYEILDTMYRQGRDRLHAPSPLIKHMVSAGLRGRKTGRGFYTYVSPGSSEVVPDASTPAPGPAGRPPASPRAPAR